MKRAVVRLVALVIVLHGSAALASMSDATQPVPVQTLRLNTIPQLESPRPESKSFLGRQQDTTGCPDVTGGWLAGLTFRACFDPSDPSTCATGAGQPLFDFIQSGSLLSGTSKLAVSEGRHIVFDGGRIQGNHIMKGDWRIPTTKPADCGGKPGSDATGTFDGQIINCNKMTLTLTGMLPSTLTPSCRPGPAAVFDATVIATRGCSDISGDWFVATTKSCVDPNDPDCKIPDRGRMVSFTQSGNTFSGISQPSVFYNNHISTFEGTVRDGRVLSGTVNFPLLKPLDCHDDTPFPDVKLTFEGEIVTCDPEMRKFMTMRITGEYPLSTPSPECRLMNETVKISVDALASHPCIQIRSDPTLGFVMDDGNSYNPDFWNDTDFWPHFLTGEIGPTQHFNNCYAYAMNKATFTYPKVGRAGNSDLLNERPETCDRVIQRAEADGLILLSRDRCDLECPNKVEGQDQGIRKVALLIRDGLIDDWHWLREHRDGTWSHKPGKGEAEIKNLKSKDITGPRDPALLPEIVPVGDPEIVQIPNFCACFCTLPNCIERIQ